MNKLFFLLLSYPLLFAPLIALMVSGKPVHAREFVFEAPTFEANCETPPSRMGNLTCQRLGSSRDQGFNDDAQNYLPSDEEVEMLEFTEEESEAAIAKFGCDCMLCLNALRQARGLPPIL